MAGGKNLNMNHMMDIMISLKAGKSMKTTLVNCLPKRKVQAVRNSSDEIQQAFNTSFKQTSKEKNKDSFKKMKQQNFWVNVKTQKKLKKSDILTSELE